MREFREKERRERAPRKSIEREREDIQIYYPNYLV